MHERADRLARKIRHHTFAIAVECDDARLDERREVRTARSPAAVTARSSRACVALTVASVGGCVTLIRMVSASSQRPEPAGQTVRAREAR